MGDSVILWVGTLTRRMVGALCLYRDQPRTVSATPLENIHLDEWEKIIESFFLVQTVPMRAVLCIWRAFVHLPLGNHLREPLVLFAGTGQDTVERAGTYRRRR